jgi:hypothetical protein
MSRMLPRNTWMLACLGLLACSSQNEPAAPSSTADASGHDAGEAAAAFDASAEESQGPDTEASEGAPQDGAPEQDGEVPADGQAVVIAATQGSTKFPFRFHGQGQGTLRLEDVSVTANVATLLFDGVPHVGVVYQYHEWTGAGYDLYDILSIAEDGSNLAVSYLYCQGTELTYAYSESLTTAMKPEPASGTCDALAQQTQTQVNLPALRKSPEPVDTGISIDGAEIQLGPAGGTITLAGVLYALLPFATVDCTACPGGPWLELHSMLLNGEQGCFTILYLFPEDKTKVQLSYTLCLPSLETPTAMYQASWSGEMLKSLTQPPLRPAPPDAQSVGEIHAY